MRYTSILLLLASHFAMSQSQPFFNVDPGVGNGLRFWYSDSYKIHMGSGTEYQFGPVSDYSIKTNMTPDAGRGWTWGVQGQTPVAALSNTGLMRIAGMFDAGGQAMALRLRSGNIHNAFTNSQINFSFSGGTGYSHSIRTRHNSSAFAGNALDFYVWQPGDAIESQGSKHVMSLNGGKVGIGTTSPANMLDVVGPEGDFKARFQGPDGYITIGPANSGWAHIYTDRPAFIFNQSVYSFPGTFSSFNTADLMLQTNGTTRLTVRNATGHVGIGTTTPDHPLTVNGTIHAEEVLIEVAVPAPDYVFEENYHLTPLDEVKAYIAQHKHLPEVPSAKEIESNGVKLGEMEMILLKKIEEMTLHLIEANNQIKRLQDNNSKQDAKINELLQIYNKNKN